MASGSSGIAVYVNVFSDLVEDDGQFRECVAQFEDLCAAIWSTPDFVAWICSPAVNRDNRYTKMSQVLSSAGADETVRKTFLVMLRKGAVSLLPEFVRILREFADERLGILRARVETATGLADSIREKIQAGLGNASGKEVALDYAVNEGVIGGMKIRTRSGVIDLSLAKKLQSAKEKLVQMRT